MPESRVEELVAAWCARDHARALVPEDHAAIDATLAARACVVEQILAGGNGDLFDGCLVLGRLLAARGGSPTLTAATMDGVLAALAPAEGDGAERAWVPFARAALAEGYAAGRLEAARGEAFAAWEFPRCAVRVDETTMAFAAGPPDDDADAVSEWAARVTLAAQRAKVRRAIVAGPDLPRRALADALSLGGIDVVTHAGEPRRGSTRGADERRPTWFPWLRRGAR